MIGCCWPPSETPPAEPLSVDAGPDDTVDLEAALTLAGSASGGTGPYTFEWTVISGPDDGITNFVDSTDPTTDVTFSGAAGTYVLQLTATDADGSVAGDTVTETVNALPFLLDNLDVQPLWAHSLGVQLRTGQVNVFRVRRSSDDAEQDFTVTDLADIDAALGAFCGSGLGYLVKVYNAVAASPYTEMIPRPNAHASQALVYSADDGGALLGATGFLVARFSDVTPNGYAGTFALVGDVAVTLVYDVHPADPDNAYAGIMGPGQAGASTGADWQSDAFYDATAAGSATSINNQTAPGSLDLVQEFCDGDTGGFIKGPSWIQWQRAAGALMSASVVRNNGVVGTLTSSFGVDRVPTFAANLLEWSDVDFGTTPGFLMSNMFVWQAVLGAPDQALVDAFELAHHA